MKLLSSSYIFVTAVIVLSISIFISDIQAAEFVPGEILVKFKDTTKASAIVNLNSDIGTLRKKEFKRVRIQHLKLPPDMTVAEAVAYYSQNPNVEYAEPNYIVRIDTTPDDSDFAVLWGLHNTGQTGGTADADIDAPEAWDLTTGSNAVVIAVVDSGVAYNHPDLSGNIWTNPGETSCSNGIDDDGNGYIDDCNGWDFVGDDNDPTDYNGHGTHVAGTIAAVGNNASGITGVMWQAQIMPVRFLGVNGTGTTADAISAILYASNNGADIINNSWGGNGYSQALKDAIEASGALVVCAAGNNGVDNDSTPHYPSSYDSSNIIAVAATNHNDEIASFSNYGYASVDVAAPGAAIYSTIPDLTYGTTVTVYGEEDFDSTSGNLPTAGSSSDLLGWQRGGDNSSWAITTGTGVGSTNSLEDSPNENYINDLTSWAGYMTPITSQKDNVYTLTFQWKGTLEEGFDFLDINYSTDGSSWTWTDYRTDTTGDQFTSDTVDFTAIAELYSSFYFGFGLTTDSSTTYDGVYIDNVTLTRKPLLISSYTYKNYNGTSMAAPHVSGIAGLIKALNPSLSNLEIKNAILNSVEVKSSLECKIATGGRVNAYNALLVAQGDPAGLANASCVTPSIVPERFNGDDGSKGGRCFIATAAYGSKMHPYVKALRDFRDKHLLNNSPGRLFVNLYYRYSPPLADTIRDSETLRLITRIMLSPLVMMVIYPHASIGIISIVLLLLWKRLKNHSSHT